MRRLPDMLPAMILILGAFCLADNAAPPPDPPNANAENIEISVSDKGTFKLPQTSKKIWHVGDHACTVRESIETVCGRVFLITPQYAVMEISSVAPLKKVRKKHSAANKIKTGKPETKGKTQKAHGQTSAVSSWRKAPAGPVQVTDRGGLSMQPAPLPASSRAVATNQPSAHIADRNLFSVAFKEKGVDGRTLVFIDQSRAIPALGTRNVLIKDGEQSVLTGVVKEFQPAAGTLEIAITKVYDANPGWLEGSIYTLAIMENAQDPAPNTHFHYLFGAGVSFDSFQDSIYIKYSAVGIRPRVAVFYDFNQSWELGIKGEITLLVLNSNQPQTLRSLIVDAQGKYKVPVYASALTIGFVGGWRYQTMLVTDNAFGVNDLAGPELYPEIGYTLSNRLNVGANAKFIPLLNKSQINLSNRQVSAGLVFDYRFLSGNSIVLSVDYSTLNYSTGSYASTLRSVVFSCGIRW